MAKEVLAVCMCPECGADGAAEIKRTKAGLLYRWCTECAAQYFPRTVEMSDRLGRAAGLSGTGTGTGANVVEPEPVTVPDAVPVPVQVPTKKRAPLWFEGLTK